MNIKLLIPFLFIWQSTIFASDFKSALISLKAEALAEESYFKGLVEEYRQECQQNIQISETQMIAAYSPQARAGEAQQSQVLWSAFAKNLDLMLTEYEKLPQNSQTELYKTDAMQNAIGFLLAQVSRAANVAFNDLVFQVKAEGNKKLETLRLKNFAEYISSSFSIKQMCKTIRQVNEDQHLTPENHHHLSFDISEISQAFHDEFSDLALYRTFFLDFKSLYAFYNYLSKYYLGSVPQQLKPEFPHAKNKWVDKINLEIDTKAVINQVANVRRLNLLAAHHERYPLEGTFILKPEKIAPLVDKLVNMMSSDFLKEVAEARQTIRKHIENQKKKAAKKRREAKKLALAALEAAAENAPETETTLEVVEENDKTPEAFEQKAEEKTVEAADALDIKLDIDGNTYFDFTKWLQNEKNYHKTDENKGQTTAEPKTKKIRLSGGAARIYETAMGKKSYQTTNKDLEQFLNQVGGHFVKCAGRHGDTKIALPNHNSKTSEFWVDKMHPMHNGSATFPVSRLKIHLRRMIEITGIDKVVE